MSTSAVHAHPEASWKQEVNRRLAEHRDRKQGAPSEPPATSAAQHNASRRAQEAAARVAARYAKAPSYSEVLANEARAALRAAEAASEAALHARAAAESVLANIEAASAAMTDFDSPAINLVPPPQSDYVEPAVDQRSEWPKESPKARAASEAVSKPVVEHIVADGQPLSILWASELPGRSSASAELTEKKRQEYFEEEMWRPASAEPIAPGIGEVELVDPALPIHGNLVEFPREIIAPRKVRPRLSESPNAEAPNVQLSIFEVEPDLVGTDPSAETMQANSAGWPHPSWSGLELDEQPANEYAFDVEEAASSRESAREIQPASLERRLLALCVDATIIAGGLVAAAALVLHSSAQLPSVKAMEHISLAALFVLSAVYMTIFYAIAPATPGMMYARIRFCTFEGHAPNSSQRWSRLGAMLLSILPAGLGLAWALFDDDNLSWHDRLSKTYISDI